MTFLVRLETGCRILWAGTMAEPALAWLRWANRAHYREQGLGYLERAVALDHPEAHFEMGLYYLEGPLRLGGEAMARAHLRRAAELGHGEAAFRLGEDERWKGLRPEGMAWITHSAGLGFAHAIHWLARAHATGDGTPVDPDAAALWAARAERAPAPAPARHSAVAGLQAWGEVDPLVRLGYGLRDLTDGALAPLAEQGWFPWVVLACGLPLLVAVLLGLYWYGLAVASVWGTAIGLLLFGIAVPPLLILVGLAWRLRRGMTTGRAHRRTEAAAAGGSSHACFHLGLASERGTADVPKDAHRARTWYLQAASEGHVEAMVRLAELLHWGAGGSRDREGAALWFERAAQRGHAQAAGMLAREYPGRGKTGAEAGILDE